MRKLPDASAPVPPRSDAIALSPRRPGGGPATLCGRPAAHGDAALDAALRASSNLIGLGDKAPVGPFALVARARDDRARLQTALESFGYYGGQIRSASTAAARRPGLPIGLSRDRAGRGGDPGGPGAGLSSPCRADRPPDPGRRAGAAAQAGDPAVAADVLAAQGRMLQAMRDDGHALANVDTPVATLEPQARAST